MNWPVIIFVAIISTTVGAVLNNRKVERGKDDDYYVNALREIKERYEGILGRSDGSIGGLVKDDDERYEDKDLGVERERIKYVNMEGEERVEPVDGFNPKRNRLQKLIKIIPRSSGLYVTELLNPQTGKRKPVATGKNIERLKEEADNLAGIKQEVNEMSREYESMKERKEKVETDNARLREQVDQLEKEVSTFADSMVRLESLVKSKTARLNALEAKSSMLETELKKLSDRHEDVQDDVETILEKAKDRFEHAREIGAMPELPQVPRAPAAGEPDNEEAEPAESAEEVEA